MEEDRIDVAIAGAGPTGLTLASVLARAGVGVALLEAEDAAGRESSRATTVHAATLELLDRLDGAGAEIAARAARAKESVLWNGDRRLARVRWDQMPTPYAGLYNLGQGETETILRARFEAAGGRVLEGTRVRTVESGSASARIEADRAADRLALSARYVVGCDGAHSAIRRSLGIPLEGSTHEERFLLGDVRLRSKLEPQRTHLFVSAGGVLGIMPLPDGSFRLNGTLSDQEELSEERLGALIRSRIGRAAGIELVEVEQLCEYRTHSRLAPRFRAGSVFIAGDAAHLNSPVGGQGMNVGIQDAVNLGWRLAGVVHGRLPSRALDSYEDERRSVAEAVLRSTESATRMFTARRPLERALRNAAMRILPRLPPVQARLTLVPAGLDQRYRPRRLPRRRMRLGGFEEGHRLPSVRLTTSGRRWSHECFRDFDHELLILADDRRAAELSRVGRQQSVRVRAVARRDPPADGILDPEGRLADTLGAAGTLVRPDGFVGWAGGDAAALGQHLEGQATLG